MDLTPGPSRGPIHLFGGLRGLDLLWVYPISPGPTLGPANFSWDYHLPADLPIFHGLDLRILMSNNASNLSEGRGYNSDAGSYSTPQVSSSLAALAGSGSLDHFRQLLYLPGLPLLKHPSWLYRLLAAPNSPK
ncbi:hypothetical protein LIER_29497 [Lithospermum erythrorhizon]|uniref:Uncharacterized protein n=1 Tax=Lithospermum erythrorhizon TaxID=34254 RepID=A0AAV3RL54_LITER